MGRDGVENVNLLFNILRIPRTTTRADWKEMHRWRRIVTRDLREAMDRQIRFAFEHSSAGLLDDATRPPVMLGPYQDSKVGPVRVMPGHVTYV